MIKQITFLITAALLLIYPVEIFSEDSDRGREIFDQVDAQRKTITYETSTMEMRIIDSRDRVRTRNLTMYTFSADDEDKSLAVFNSPADVRGTGLLSITEDGNTLQLLYLPALGRTQSISGSQRTERFMGSDFTYEDLGNQDPDDFDFELLEDTGEIIRIEAIPKTESQYDRIIYHIDPDRFILLKSEYFYGGDQIKELTASEYNEVRDGIWRPDKMVMRDLKNNRRTELVWSERSFDEEIPDRYFTERHLQRGLR